MGVVAFFLALVVYVVILVIGGERLLHESGRASAFVVVMVGILLFTWLVILWFWWRGRQRASAVRNRMPDAVIFEVLGDLQLSLAVSGAEKGFGLPTYRFPSRSYVTATATADGLRFFSGGSRAVLCGWLPADRIASVDLRIAEFRTYPIRGPIITRHFPSVVIVFTDRTTLAMLPVRTTLCVPRKLSAPQLEALRSDIATALGRTVRA